MKKKKKNIIRWSQRSPLSRESNSNFEGTNLYFFIYDNIEKRVYEYCCQIDARVYSDGKTLTLQEAKEACEAVLQKYVKKNIKATERRLQKLKKMVRA